MTSLFPQNTCPSLAELPEGFLEFLGPLHALLTPRQQGIIRSRAYALRRSLEEPHGLPSHPRPYDNAHKMISGWDWKVTLPGWIRDQRNQMTGPADDGDLVVKMLNSGAPGVMIDLEDSMANEWPNLMAGIDNAVAALQGTLTYKDKKGATVGIKPSDTVTFTRVRGLHMSQHGIFDGPMSASLFDAALLVYKLDPSKLKHPLCLYIPKSESHGEAIWWSACLKELALAKGMPMDWIKCMALVEAHPFAYQMEEFIWTLRDHLIGLNLGRWDYMASLIHFTMADPTWVLPDRNTIPHDVPFFQNLRELMAEICHKRGIFAIGGMTALYPSRSDPELDARAKAALATDKGNEAAIGFDGAWTGHPDQNAIAVGAFPEPNQLAVRKPELDRYVDLRPSPADIGKTTLDGTRRAVRIVIRYRKGVLDGKGASLLDGYMEDLATDRICRNMIAQRIRHGTVVENDDGSLVRHNDDLVDRLFLEELHKIVTDPKLTASEEDGDRYTIASALSRQMIRNGEFDPS